MGSSLKHKIGFWGGILTNLHFSPKGEVLMENEEGSTISDLTTQDIKDYIKNCLLEIVDGLEFEIQAVNGNRVEYTIKIKEEK